MRKGPFKCYVTLFSREFDPHPPPRNALFPGKKADTLHGVRGRSQLSTTVRFFLENQHFIFNQWQKIRHTSRIQAHLIFSNIYKYICVQCLIQDKISTSPRPTDRAPRGRARSSHWAIFLLNNIAITNNSTFPKIKLHYSISYCNKPNLII